MGLNPQRLLLIAFVTLGLPATAGAQPPSGPVAPSGARDEAITRFRRGLELYEEQDYNAALIEFRKAYELAPNYKVLYNVGQVCFQLQDYACALKSFESYLFEGASDLSAERRTEVNRELDKLRNRVARLEVTTNVPGVDVTIDDVSIGKTPFPSAVVVSAGKRRISAMREGRVPITRTIDVPGAETIKINLELIETQADVQYRDRPSKMTKYSWLGIGVAGALGVSAAVTGVMSMGASSDLKSMRFVGVNPNAEVSSKQSTVKTLAIATDVLAGAAIVTLVTTLVLTFTRTTPENDEKAKPGVSFRITPTGGALSGEF